MNRSTRSLLAVLGLVALGSSGCRSEPEAEESGPAPEIRLPASALAGAVRALETLAAARPADALVQVRALECDELVDRAKGAEYVRVFLHLSVYAGSGERARTAFDELRAALTEGAHRAEGTDPVAAARAEHVLGELDWNPPGREDLVSFSDAIRLELPVTRAAPVAAGGARAADPAPKIAPPPSVPIESYVRSRAGEGIGEVDLSLRQVDPEPDVTELVCRIEEPQPSARHTRAAIGAFLAALEAGSPAARVTALRIERSQHEPDPEAARAWTFEAELTVRVPEGAERALVPAGWR